MLLDPLLSRKIARRITTAFRDIAARTHNRVRGLILGEEDVTDLIIADVNPPHRLARCWVTGYIEYHQFEALLYPRHALRPGLELGTSLISKLYVRQLANDEMVAVYERQWDLRPTTEAAQRIVDLLVSQLAELVYGSLLRQLDNEQLSDLAKNEGSK